MKKIVILGGSAAAVYIIEQVRAFDQAAEITLISFDGHYPYRRDLFVPRLAKTIAADTVFQASKDYFAKNNVQVLLDKKITRLNTKRNAIFTEDKEQINYDLLFITDTPENRFPAVKGATKERIFGFKKFSDVEQLVKEMPLIETAAVHSGSFWGLQVAAAIASRKKEVLVVSLGVDFISRHFDGDVAQWLIGRLHDVGVNVVRDNPLAEILGDKDAKAIRLRSGKVYATDVNIFLDFDEDLRLFAGSELATGRGVIVDSNFRSSISNIFALDQVATFRQTAIDDDAVNLLEVLQAQAKTAVGAVFGQNTPFEVPALVRNIKLEGLDLTVIGQTARFPDIEVRRDFEPVAGQYKALYIRADRIVGAILINAESQAPVIAAMINDKAPVPAVEPAVISGDETNTVAPAIQGQNTVISSEGAV